VSSKLLRSLKYCLLTPLMSPKDSMVDELIDSLTKLGLVHLGYSETGDTGQVMQLWLQQTCLVICTGQKL